MSVELHTRTRGSLRPDPECDPVLAVFYYLHNDWPLADPGGRENSHLGVIAIDVENCNFKPVHSSKQTAVGGGGTPRKSPTQSPRKQPMKSPAPSPRKQPMKSPAKSPQRQPIVSPTKSPAKASADSSAKMATGAGESAGDGGQGSRPLDSALVQGYLDHCGVGRGVEVTYVRGEVELMEEVARMVRR